MRTRTRLGYTGIFLFALFFHSLALAQDKPYSLSISGSYSTSSELFYNIDDPNQADQFLAIDDIFGFGVDVRRRIGGDEVQVGLSIEYLSKLEPYVQPAMTDSIGFADGFTAIPIELTGYFVIPFSSDRVQLYMGGGAGLYLGSRQYHYGNEREQTLERKPGFGIHILSGIQYSLNPSFALRSEVKFRNVQFETTDMIPTPSAGYLTFLQQTSSRVMIDGMTFTLGVVFLF